jgi:predicted aminopeptidase
VRALQALVFVAVSVLSGCWTLTYLTHQAIGELRILHSRRRIVDVLGDPKTGASTRARLGLAWEARKFGVEALGLRDGDAFTRFVDLHGKPVAWSVWAAEKDRLVPHTHAFPIAGRVPYLGFFSERDAQREEERLKREGYDTYVALISGFSTTGVLSDPIYSSMIDGSDARIVEVTLHEMLHATVYLPSHTAWNESLATVVGYYGAIAFFAARADQAGAARVAAESRVRKERQKRFGAFVRALTTELNALYAQPLSRAEKLARREVVFAHARAEFARLFPPRGSDPMSPFLRAHINNALVIASSTYYGAGPEHLRVLDKVHGDLAAFVRVYKTAMERDKPLDWLARYVAKK